MLDAYDLARLKGFAGTCEEFHRLEYLRGGVDVAKASGFEGDAPELVEKMHHPSTAAAMALLDMLKGDTGPIGPKGERGQTGLDLFQLAQQAGFTGSLDEYLASLKGETGPQGKPGIKGESGLKGIKGDQGDAGRDGANGEMPDHEIEGNKVRFATANGWGNWIDLGGSVAQASSMGAGTLSIHKFYDAATDFPAIGKSQILYFDMSASPWGTYIWTGSAYQATGGGADLLRDWGFYSANWSTPPTIVGATAVGNVYLYVLGAVTRYRLVPTIYSASLDAFYLTFSAGVLSDLVATRG